MSRYTTLAYPGSLEVPQFSIDILPPDGITEDIAHAMLALQTDAYEAHFEDPKRYSPALPAGTVREHFKPDDQNAIRARQARMLQFVEHNGSSYLSIVDIAELPESTANGEIPGMIKVSPSAGGTIQQKVGMEGPNLFINDLIVHPNIWGVGAATILLHAGISLPEYSPKGRIALHAYRGSVINKWFNGLGIVECSADIEPVEIGTHRLPQMLMVSESGLTRHGLVERLEELHPHLAYVRRFNRNSDTAT